MEIKKVYAVYFSPTGTTGKTVTAAAEGTGLPFEKHDLTVRKTRQAFQRSFEENELVIAGLPVYAGRLPKNLDDFFSGLKGNNTAAVAMIMYGNREYEDALIELKIKLEERGFKVVAGAAFIGEHTFSKKIAAGRPNTEDLKIAKKFGKKVIKGIGKTFKGKLTVPGNYPYVKPGFDPTQPGGPLTTLGKIGTAESCTRCGLCAENCPWDSITHEYPYQTDFTKCLRCFRCIKICPVSARILLDPKWHDFVPDFEKWLSPLHKEPEFFYGE